MPQGATRDDLFARKNKQGWAPFGVEMKIVDGENNEIRVIRREDGAVVGSFGHNGRNAGQFHWVHTMAIDARGNLYTGEVDTGKRIQKFRLTSDALR